MVLLFCKPLAVLSEFKLNLPHPRRRVSVGLDCELSCSVSDRKTNGDAEKPGRPSCNVRQKRGRESECISILPSYLRLPEGVIIYFSRYNECLSREFKAKRKKAWPRKCPTG